MPLEKVPQQTQLDGVVIDQENLERLGTLGGSIRHGFHIIETNKARLEIKGTFRLNLGPWDAGTNEHTPS
jgi:hypothetical protein